MSIHTNHAHVAFQSRDLFSPYSFNPGKIGRTWRLTLKQDSGFPTTSNHQEHVDKQGQLERQQQHPSQSWPRPAQSVETWLRNRVDNGGHGEAEERRSSWCFCACLSSLAHHPLSVPSPVCDPARIGGRLIGAMLGADLSVDSKCS